MRRETAVLEEAKKVRVLSVNVTCADRGSVAGRDTPADAETESVNQTIKRGSDAVLSFRDASRVSPRQAHRTRCTTRGVAGPAGPAAVPQIFIGASSSNRHGCDEKTSLDA